MAGLHQSTERRLEEMSARINEAAAGLQSQRQSAPEGISVDSLLPMLFGGLMPPQSGASATIINECDGHPFYDGDDDGDDEGVDEGDDEGVDEGDDEGVDEGVDDGVDEGDDEGDDGEEYTDADDERIKRMLLAQIERIDESLASSNDTQLAPPAAAEVQSGVEQVVGVDQYKAMKVDELRRILKDAGLDWRGNKEVLVDRIISMTAATPPSNP